ncbi:MAG: amidohydrolase [Cyanobacteria bacterium J06641_5]
MLNRIQALTEQFAPRLLEIRRHLHAHPELSGQEYKTAAYVSGILASCGLEVREEVGRTGVIGELKGSGSDRRTLALRVDMDALPINEAVDVPFKSHKAGVMHACGHDLHSTLGLGVAMVLSNLGEEASLPGTLRLLFQPAEETTEGARWLVEAGAMDGVEGVLGVHVYPSIPAQTIGIRYGALTAAADELELTIEGEAGHGARPHEALDAIWIAAQVIGNLQQAIARTQNPLRPVVLTFGKIAGGRAPNIIADRVELAGTVRSLHPETRADLPGWIESIVAGTCKSYGARYRLNYVPLVPAVFNDPTLTQILEGAARSALGDDRVQIIHEPSLGAEDFSHLLECAPGSMCRLGVGFSDRPNYPLHHPKFEPDEAAIVAGVATLATAAWQYFQQ